MAALKARRRCISNHVCRILGRVLILVLILSILVVAINVAVVVGRVAVGATPTGDRMLRPARQPARNIHRVFRGLARHIELETRASLGLIIPPSLQVADLSSFCNPRNCNLSLKTSIRARATFRHVYKLQ